MKYDFTLTHEQQILVEQNLELVKRVIARYIKTNENVYGLGYDDLYQEGAVALCRAAATYVESPAKFTTYATTIVKNHLIDCCRAANARQKHLCSLPVGYDLTDDESPHAIPEPSVAGEADSVIDQIDTAALLAQCKMAYKGAVRLGIEALELTVKDFDTKDIARLYNSTPSTVGSRISRAKKALRQNAAFCLFYGKAVENGEANS